MPAEPTTSAPTFCIIGTDAEPSDAAIAALSRLLLAAADREIETTKDRSRPGANGTASVKSQESSEHEY